MNKVAFESGKERNAAEYSKLRDTFKTSSINLYSKLYKKKKDALSDKDMGQLYQAAEK